MRFIGMGLLVLGTAIFLLPKLGMGNLYVFRGHDAGVSMLSLVLGVVLVFVSPAKQAGE